MGKFNILFFFTDDQRFDTIRALGNDEIYTPNLDKLVASGVVFTHAHIAGGTCGAVCMPSRAMLHTGRSLFHIEKDGEFIPDEHITMGEHFRKADYECYGIGKWHNGRESFARSFNGGDEIFFGGMDDHWNVPVYHYDPTGRYDAKHPYIRDPFYSNEVWFRYCDHIHHGKHSSELFADSAIEFLDKYDGEEPFFLYVSLMAPHDPRTMPERFLKMYDPAKIKLPPNFLPEHPIDTGALRIRDEMLAKFPRDPEEIKRHIAEYYAMISHLDYEFGRVIDALKRNNLHENTIIVFSGDNGLAVGQHGLMGKQNLYDHSVRVPLMFAGPKVPSGRKTDALVYLFDIFPTLCELTGTSVPPSVEGKSLIPCFSDPNFNVRDALYLAYGDTIRGVRTDRYKLIEYACGESQLFDLANDPHETNNLIDIPTYTSVVEKMRKRLKMLRDEWDDIKHHTGQKFWQGRRDIL